MTTLTVVKISKNSAEQRKGRAGRTAPGNCYRLFSLQDFEKLDESSTPEIKRKPLSLTAVTLYDMGIDPEKFQWLEHPGAEPVKQAVHQLKSLGAVFSDCNGVHLTDIGKTIAALQIEPGLGRMVHYSSQQGN